MIFEILGPLRIHRDGRDVPLASRKERALLGVLLLEGGRVVSVDHLIDEVWGDRPPNQPVNSLRVLASRLRRTLADGGLSDRIRTAPPGYLIAVQPDELDMLLFQRSLREGSTLVDEGAFEQAAEVLRLALGMWRGDVLADVELGDSSALIRRRLEADRLLAIEQRIEADLGCGRSLMLVSELDDLVEKFPLHETFWTKLVVALARCGRHAEALRRAAEFHEALAELGLEPSRGFLDTQAGVLAQASGSDRIGEIDQPDISRLRPIPLALATEADDQLIGRGREMARLEAIFDDVAAGESATALISGEPGIGKTSLVRDAVAHFYERGATVLFGRCDEDLDIGYQPFREALQNHLGALSGAARAQILDRWPRLAMLAGPFGGAFDGAPIGAVEAESDLMLLFETVEGWLRDLSRIGPVVLVIDDLQWAGTSTIQLTRHLTRQQGWPVLTMLAFRDTDARDGSDLRDLLANIHRSPSVHRLSLGGLDRDAIATLVEARQQGATAPAQIAAARIHEETGGNPLFATQLIGHLAEVGIDLTGAGDEFQLPDGVRDVIRYRLTRLSDAANQVLRIAATIGPTSPFALLSAVSLRGDTEGLLDALDEAVLARLLVETSDADFVFVHALVRRTVYDGVSAARRRQLHRRVGEALLLLPGPLPNQTVMLAHHFSSGAGPGDGARAAKHCLDAGMEAFAEAAHESALKHFDRGLDLLERYGPADPALESDLYYGVAEACLRIYDLDRRDSAAWHAVEAARAAGSSERLGRAAFTVARTAVVGVLDDRVVDVCREALDGLGPEPSALKANVSRALASQLMFAGDGLNAARLAAEAVEMARITGDPSVLIGALEARAATLGGQPDIARRIAVADEMVALAQRSRDRSKLAYAHCARAIPRLILGDRTGFDDDYATMADLARRLRDGYLQAIAVQWMAATDLLDGRFGEAEVHAAEAVERANKDRNFVTGWAAQVIWLRHEQGRLAEVLPLIEGAVSDNPGIVAFRSALALAYAAVGSTDEARHHLEEVVADPQAIPYDWLRTCTLATCAEVAATLEATRAAADLERLLRPYKGQLVVVASGTHCQGAVDRYRGMLAIVTGEYGQAEQLLSAALVLEEEARSVTSAARTRLWYARALLHRADRIAMAHDLAREAAVSAARLGMPGVHADASAVAIARPDLGEI